MLATGHSFSTISSIAIAILIILLFEISESRIAPHQNTRWHQLQGQPGIKLRLTRKGAEYVKNIAVKVKNSPFFMNHAIPHFLQLLNEQLATLRGFRAQVRLISSSPMS